MFTTFDVVLLVLGMPIAPDTMDTKSLGGAESAGIYLAKELARAGARVSLYCNTRIGWEDEDGVLYRPATGWPRFASEYPHDVCIVQRNAEAFSQRINSRLNLLWSHDLALGRTERQFRSVLWNIDRVIVLSQFMRDQYKQVYKLDDSAFFLSRNGIASSLMRRLRSGGVDRDPKKIIYSARPERGLDLLLNEIMPRLLSWDPALRLHIASYDNRPEDLRGFYAQCEEAADRLGPNVVKLGCLAKAELYRHYLSAGLYLYPTPSPSFANFREISCITAMECQAAGLPIVTSRLGALPETIAPGAGILLDVDPNSNESRNAYVAHFVESTIKLLNDTKAWSAASSCGVKKAEGLDWSGVAKEWLSECERLIRSRNESPARLVRHFWRTSDIVAAKSVLSRAGERSGDEGKAEECRDLATLLSDWSFMDEVDGYRRQYEIIGRQHEDYVYDSAPSEPRFQVLNQWLNEQRRCVRTVLDYGCAHGAYAIGIAKVCTWLQIHGVDIDQYSIAMATRQASDRGVDGRATFAVWRQEAEELVVPGTAGACDYFDCAILQEVLEHVPEPWKVLAQVERRVRPGGKVYITVPFGPWEFTSYRSYPHRCHIWQFDRHDLRDMVRSKPDLTVEALASERNPLSGEPQGWWVITYTADHRLVEPIDMERHTWLQRPRQSLSAAILAGPNAEETLHWLLRSIQDVVDEIVMGDCGMSEEARRIAGQYAVRIIKAPNPLEHGFDCARNHVLQACKCDWCLWIDTDERLVGGDEVEKYLRENAYHAYSVRQHNFACDSSSSPDMPVRLFRRRPFKERELRFWGAIHEHPAIGLNDGAGPCIALRDIHIAHVGYLAERDRKKRFARNLPLLELDQVRYPERLVQKHFLMRDNMHLVRYGLLRNGGQVDDAIREKCLQTIDLYRRHFLGRSRPARLDSLEYYSEALTVLGEGFEAVFQVEVDKEEARPNGMQRFRFGSAEELNAELRRITEEKASGLESPWW